MKGHKTTIKDIAKVLGISASTVSRALQDHPDINEETKHKVTDLAKQLKYKPNTIALSLKNNRSNTIGVIIPQIVHHFFSSVISGIEDIASKSNYRVMIYQSNESYERELINMDAMLSSYVDGMIVAMTKETNNFDHFKSAIDDEIPMVFFDRISPELKTDQVIIDDYNASFNLTEHLISVGCKHIIHFAGPQVLQLARLRKQGYIDALMKHNIPVDENLIFNCDKYEQSIEITKQLIESNNLPDGIFAVNDNTAIGAVVTLKKYGIKIPEQVAVAGFTNGLITMVTDPPLTTVEQNGFFMGQKAAEMILARITNKYKGPPRIEIIPTMLIIRESTSRNI